MSVKPTMRDKRRYVSFMVEAESPVSEKEVFEAVLGSILSFLGELGYSKANPKPMKFESSTGFGILRCAATETDSVRSSLAFLSKINGKRAAIRLLSNSGSIRKLKKNFKS